ncbi:MAG TPA: dihydrodipicolinate synthase family protein [Solirubrobacteraceae bacterium]|jgi:4-hydroxy-tetrahydrodipicolinate synthase|nr:dihydrodipicolinate synthase family protein [Solirubrobacteraceae bacterium]
MTVAGILPVIPTPFRDGRFDRTSFQRLLDHMLPSVDGYVLLGSTGEAPSLTTAERCEIAEFALAHTPSDRTVVVGVTHTALADSIALVEHAQGHGAAGVLCAAPFYFKNSADGILRYLRGVDAALDIELIFYDNPDATKTQVAPGDPIRWSRELEHLTAVKLTDHDLSKVATWQEAGLRVFGGDDPIAFRYLAAGVDGVIIIAPAIFPGAFRQCWDAVRSGNITVALEIFSGEILPFIHVFGIGDEIATSKAILAAIGVFDSPEVLAPLEAATASRTRILRDAYDIGCRATAERVAGPQRAAI